MKKYISALALFSLLAVPHISSAAGLKAGTYCFWDHLEVYPDRTGKWRSDPVKILSVSPDGGTAMVRTTGLIGILGGGFQVNTCDLYGQKQTPKDAAKKIELASIESKGTKVSSKETSFQKSPNTTSNGVK